MPDSQDEFPIAVTDVSKSFGKQTIFHGFNLQVARGETLSVLGRSGTGKSVLLRLLIGLEKPDSGSVRVTGKEMTQLAPNQLAEVRKKMGFLFQQAALYDSLTVEENVAFPLSRHSTLSNGDLNRRVRELLANVGMEKDLRKLPSQISGGMQKRVGLARAMALDPEVLLFDEPTAGLDPITAAEIGRLIRDLNEKGPRTTIVVTHDLPNAKIFSDRLVLVEKGNIVAEGTFADVEKSRDPFVAEFLGAAAS